MIFLTFWHVIVHPVCTGLAGLDGFVGSNEESIAFHPQVKRSLKMSQDWNLLLERLDFGN